MEHPAIRMLEDLGFVDEGSVSSQFKGLSRKRTNELRQFLRWSLRDIPDSEDITGPFSFLASAQFRGDRCCSLPDCRLSAIPGVNRFAALYADRLIFPVLIGTDEQVFGKDLLEGAVRVLLELRPLIRAGIVIPTNTSPSLCTTCHEAVAPLYGQARQNLAALVDRHIQEFRVEIKEKKRRSLGMEYFISGPKDFLSEGKIVYVAPQLPSWAKPGEFAKRTALKSEQILRTGILKDLFEASVRDFILQSVVGSQLGTTYLTNQVGEAEFFAIAPAEYELANRRMEALSNLSHVLPAFSKLSLNQIVRLRKKEQAAFVNYRNAVSKAIKECEDEALAGRTPTDLLDDVIRPELDELEARDIAEKHTRRSRLATRMMFGAFGATFGALATGLHPGLGAAIGAAIGCLNQTAADDIVGSVESSPEVKSNSLYFLLSMKQAAS